MKIQVEVKIPQGVVDRVTEMVTQMHGHAPSNEQLVEFFKNDLDCFVFEQYTEWGDIALLDAVEAFFYV